MKTSEWGIDSKLVHGGYHPDATGAVNVPIYQSSTFAFRNAAHGAALFAGIVVDEAEDIALTALAPFGREYLDVLRTGFAGRWKPSSMLEPAISWPPGRSVWLL